MRDISEIVRVAAIKVLTEKPKKSEEGIYSFSRLEVANCLRRFYIEYVLKKKTPSGPAAVLGKIVHEAIAGIIEPERLADIDITKDIDSKLAKNEIDLNEAEILVKAARVVEGMGSVEQHYIFPLDSSDPFAPRIQMYLDLKGYSGNIPCVVDFKTNRTFYEPTDNMQLPLYALAIAEETGAQEVLGILRFLRFKGEEGIKQHLITRVEMEEARKWALAKAVDLESRKTALDFGGDPEQLFPADPEAGQCRYCGHAQECQKYSENKPNSITTAVAKMEKGELEITSPEQAQEIAAEILRLKNVSDKLSNALKSYCETTGETVQVGDQQYGPNVQESWSFTAEQKKVMAKAMVDEGVNPWDVLTLGAPQLKKLNWSNETLKSFGGVKTMKEVYKWSKVTAKTVPVKTGGSDDAKEKAEEQIEEKAS
jgi:hypothetical protein